MELALIVLSVILFTVVIYLFINKHTVDKKFEEAKHLEEMHFKHLSDLFDHLDETINDFRMSTRLHLEALEKNITILEDNHLSDIKNANEKISIVKDNIDQYKLDNMEQIKKLVDILVGKINSVREKTEGSFESVNQKLVDIQDNLNQLQLDNTEQLTKIVDFLINKINSIKSENDILRKKLEYFTEIKDDSNLLNETVDIEKENELIQSILKGKKTSSEIEKPIANEPILVDITTIEPIESKKLDELQFENEVITTQPITDKELFVTADENFSIIEYSSIENLHDTILNYLANGTQVFIKIGSAYSLSDYIGTIQKINSISELYPNKKTFYIKFEDHNIAAKSVEQYLIRNDKLIEPNVVHDNIDRILDKQQEKAYDMMENTNHNLFISGKAGTGKSFLLKLFSQGSKKKHLVVAPTGIAALNVGGVTIHSAFGYNNLELGNELEFIKLKNEKKDVLKNIDVLIIDEISMVRVDILDRIDLILQKLNNNTSLFGGKQVFVFGDLFQLPPIATGDEYKYLQDRYGSIFFFNSDAYRNGNFQYIELFENHRQNNDKAFFNILNNIREGNITPKDIENLNRRHSESLDLRRILKLFPKKERVEIINNDELSKISAKEYLFEAITEYVKDSNLSKNIENIFPISMNLVLKLGTLIMMVKNDVDRRWVNGTLGIVSYIDYHRLKVTIDGTEYEVVQEDFESKEAKYSNGKITYETVLRVRQYPLILAYAITIHKSQGMTYKNVACDLTETFESGQSYIALSRCSSLEGLHLIKKITGKEIKVNPAITAFYKRAHSISV